jgi:hypothetical protein
MTTTHPRRNGLSSSAIAGIVVGALVVLAAGYGLGRMSSGEPRTTAGPADPSAPSPSPAQATPAGQATATPAPQRPGQPTVTRVGETPAPVTPAAGSSPGPAPIVFDPPLLDFGYVRPDVEMKGTIRLTNRGDRPTRILHMQPDCKCTTLQDLAGTVIAPGETISFEAVMEGRSTPGAKRSKIKFVFEGYDQTSSVSINSHVQSSLVGDPPWITPVPGEEATGTTVVRSVDGTPFRITASGNAPPVYADDFDPASSELRSSYELTWDLTRYDQRTCLDREGRRMPEWWVIETDSADTPLVELFIRHRPCSLPESPRGRKWALSKQRALLNDIPAGQPAEFDIYLKWLTKDKKPNDTIKEVRTESPLFDAELLSKKRDGERITCHVRITPKPGHVGLFQGRIRFFGYQPGHSHPLVVIGRVVEGDEKVSQR